MINEIIDLQSVCMSTVSASISVWVTVMSNVGTPKPPPPFKVFSQVLSHCKSSITVLLDEFILWINLCAYYLSDDLKRTCFLYHTHVPVGVIQNCIFSFWEVIVSLIVLSFIHTKIMYSTALWIHSLFPNQVTGQHWLVYVVKCVDIFWYRFRTL